MIKVQTKVTDSMDFFKDVDPIKLVEEFGSPLYVCNERILRERCRQMKNLATYPNYRVNYSAKANTNLAFLQVVKSEGLDVDAMSPGEITMELMAGFDPSSILYISNNVSREEMQFAIDRNITTSVDSLAQLKQYGELNPGGKVAIRFNPGVGAGHHEKVVTGGKKTKFGVNSEYIPEVKALLKEYNLKLIGLNQHIGSLFMDGKAYTEAAQFMVNIAKNFDDLEFCDFGGGFGIPYKKEQGEQPIDLKEIGKTLDEFMFDFAKQYGKEITFKVEPGRFISAESTVLLGTVHCVKNNDVNKFVGTDLGFNVLARPMMYDSFHGVEIYGRKGRPNSDKMEEVSIVGNICESGDIIAKHRELPEIFQDDILGILDAGAYGHMMSSNYNCRLRPAEIMLRENGKIVKTRNRDVMDDITKHYISL